MFMMCHRIGFPPISTIGFGRRLVSSDKRDPIPPARITAFIQPPLLVLRPAQAHRFLKVFSSYDWNRTRKLRGLRRADQDTLGQLCSSFFFYGVGLRTIPDMLHCHKSEL